jgi:hypothetical protein
MDNQVVGHFLDGRLVKGRSFDFSPGTPTCHIQLPSKEQVAVPLGDLKALFVVKSLQGDRTYQESQEIHPADPRRVSARPVSVRFRDGETIVGLVTAYSDERSFFFLLPADRRSNNIRILVNRQAAVAVTLLPAFPARPAEVGATRPAASRQPVTLAVPGSRPA